jgi:hypothetical protein
VTATPVHPDFALIAQVVAEADDLSDQLPMPNDYDSAHAMLQQMHAGAVDVESLHAAAKARAITFMCSLPPALFLSDPVHSLATVYIDAFLAGVRFQQRGGHTA